MALPTLPSYWTSRYKNIHERAMVERRNKEEDFREQWSHRDDYFKSSEVQMTKQNAWTSEQSFHDSMDAFKSKHDQEVKAIQMKDRRRRLRQMLQDEKNQLEAELHGMSGDNYSRLQDMKDKSDDLKTSRETHRKQIAEEKIYKHWRQNNPDLRKIESEMHKKYVTNAWTGQKQEREEQMASARETERRVEEAMERERQAALELERRMAESRLEEEKAMAAELKDQVRELRDREMEAETLKAEQDDIAKQQWDLEKLEEERQELETQRQKAEFGRALVSQYKAKLRRRARQVQEALELDRKILEAVAKKESQEHHLNQARKDKAQADAAWMKSVIDEQLKLEKAREAELDTLFKEEAARQWSKRESEWEKERLARERLMAEVLQGRQDQLHTRMEENRQQQEESLQRREELLREMEVAQQLTQREKEEETRRKKDTKKQFESQMTERNERKRETRLRFQEELDAERRAEEDYEEMLREEASRLNLEDFEPKSYPRTTSRLSSRPESTVPLSSRPGSALPSSRPESRSGFAMPSMGPDSRPGFALPGMGRESRQGYGPPGSRSDSRQGGLAFPGSGPDSGPDPRRGRKPGPKPGSGAAPDGWRRPGPITAWE